MRSRLFGCDQVESDSIAIDLGFGVALMAKPKPRKCSFEDVCKSSQHETRDECQHKTATASFRKVLLSNIFRALFKNASVITFE